MVQTSVKSGLEKQNLSVLTAQFYVALFCILWSFPIALVM